MDIERFHGALAKGKIEWRRHVLERIAERGLRQGQIIEVRLRSEKIEDYPSDKPFPSALFPGHAENKSIHVVASFDEANEYVYIITAYEPTSEFFESDLKTSKKP